MERVKVVFPFQFTHGAEWMTAIIGAGIAAAVRAAAHHGFARLPARIAVDMANLVS
jgi:hypothetical protein